ncbi:MAG TPA: OB-fold domain-containing protein [Thermodesulfobacteriota bacterium]|nr:OB-fold domain-containing protein [Thermodesulfobacteriota bacterium]
MSATEEVNGLSLLVRRDEKGPYLIGGKCTSCQAVFFPKQSICPRCTGKRIEETPLSRKGKLYTYTEVYQKPPDYEGRIPYFIGRVLLPEGVFVLAQLKAKKEDLRINAGMKLVIEPIYCDESGKEIIGYKFTPA